MQKQKVRNKIILTFCILPLLACGCLANDNTMLENFYTMTNYSNEANNAFEKRNYSKVIKYADLGLDYFENNNNIAFITKTLQEQNAKIEDLDKIKIGLYCLKGISELHTNKMPEGKNDIKTALSINPDVATHILLRISTDTYIKIDNKGKRIIKNKKVMSTILDEIIATPNISQYKNSVAQELKEEITVKGK